MAAAARGEDDRVGVSIIAGALGAGKTTLLTWLAFRAAPAVAERWVAVLNEFGEAKFGDGVNTAITPAGAGAGVAGAFETPGSAAERAILSGQAAIDVLDQSSTVAGGCVCCTSAPLLESVLAGILRKSRRRGPRVDRILLEPSSLASHAALLAVLRGHHLGAFVRADAVVFVVDARPFADGAAAPAAGDVSWLAVAVAETAAAATTIVGTRCVDAAQAEAALPRLRAWAAALPPLPGGAERRVVVLRPAAGGSDFDAAWVREPHSSEPQGPAAAA